MSPRRPARTAPTTPTRLARALLGVALLLGLVLLGSGGPQATGSAAAAESKPPVSIALDSIAPTVPAPGGTLVVTGVLRNTSTAAVSQVSVRLRISTVPLVSRGQIAALAAGTQTRDGYAVGSPMRIGSLAPGQAEPFHLTLPLDSVGLGVFGVYPLNIEAVGAQKSGFGQLGIVRTFLPWAGRVRQYTPSHIAWVWPLTSPPDRPAGAAVGAATALADQLAPTGRLGQLVDAGAGQPVTWVVDPNLLDAASNLAAAPESAVTGPASTPTPGLAGTATPTATPSPSPSPTQTGTPSPSPTETGSPSPSDTGSPTPTAAPGPPTTAQDWLRALQTASTGSEVVALPYADPDLVAVQRAGLGRDLGAAAATGQAVAEQVLGRPVVADVAWPADGVLDPSTAAALAGDGMGAVLLSPQARPVTKAPTFTPTGRTEVATPNGSLAGLVYDATLSHLAAASTSTPGSRALLVQRFLAETAMLTAERPGDPRTVLVVPPRQWDPAPGLAAELIRDTAAVPWVDPVPLSSLRAEAPDQGVDRRSLTYSSAMAKHELPANDLAVVRSMEHQLTVFAQILTRPADVVPAYQQAFFRLESVSWRNRQKAWNTLVATVAGQSAGLRAAVHLAATNVTLGSKSGVFPLTVVNDLAQPVKVSVRLAPRTARLEVGATGTLTIDAQRRDQINVPARANANGLVIVDARLTTPSGAPLDGSTAIQVRVTQIGTVGLLIVFGAALVLFVAAGVRLGRRALAARAGQGGAGE